MGEVSLLDGWLPWAIYVLTPVAVALGVAWRRPAWRRQIAWGLGAAVVVATGAAVANRTLGLAPYGFPSSFYAWAGVIVCAVTSAVVGMRSPGWPRRAMSVGGAVLSVLLLGTVVNGHYDYYPTLGNALGRTDDVQVELPEVAALRARVQAGAPLPTEGVSLHVAMPGTRSGFAARDGYVYLPPAYFATPQPELPVLVLVHGTPGGPEDWLVGGQAGQVVDAFAAEHDGRAPILVMPDATGSELGDTECTDGARGQVETYLTVDVPAYVRATFAVATGSRSWGIAGLSMGGYCALVLSLRHPQQFVVFGDYSGLARAELDPPASALTDLFGGDQRTMDGYDATDLLRARRYPGLAGWFEVGRQDDQPLHATEAVAAQAAGDGLTTCLLVRDGGHDFAFWHEALEHSLPWMSVQLGLIPPPVDTHGARCSP